MREDYEIVEGWKQTGLLNGIAEEFHDSVAYLMENQRLYNEGSGFPVEFNRVSIPLLRRVFPLLSKHVRVESYLTEEFPRFLETELLFKVPKPSGDSGMEILKAEADATAKLAESLANVLADFAKAKKAKVFYLECLGLENGKLVAFYEM
jgi:hypothetical protein